MNNTLKQKEINPYLKAVIILIPVALALYLALIAPYMMDDWAWATSTGQERLDSFFAGYNGRYLGNLYILALSKSLPLWCISLCVAALFLPYAVYKFSGSKSITVYLLTPAAVSIMSAEMFRQIIMWRSGFSNYVPPLAAVLLYLVIIRNVFDNEAPHYKKLTFLLTFFIGAAGALFMENVTLYAVLLGAAVLIYTKYKFKKVFAPHISYLIGSICGAAIMFTNSAYLNIFNNHDEVKYRTFAGLSPSPAHIKNIATICICMFESNYRMFLTFSAILFLLAVRNLSNKKISKKRFAVLTGLVAYQVAYSLVMMVFYDAVHQVGLAFYIGRVLSAALLFLSFAAAILLMHIERKDKEKAIFAFLSSAVLIAPLVIITPVSPRCFFAPYIMVVLAESVMLKNLLESSGKITSRAAFASVTAVFIAGSIHYAVNFTEVHEYHQIREQYIQAQIDADADTIEVPMMPKKLEPFSRKGDYIDKTVWKDRFCEFYNIDNENKTVIQTKWEESNFKQYGIESTPN
ncbi:MAG: DUF6056 family protein [Acutalibacteraceae bacterium]